LTNRFVAGVLGQPFGLEGFIKLRSFSGETAHLERLSQMLLCKNGVTAAYSVAEIRSWPGVCHVRFAGFDTPEKAKTLSGAEIVVERKDAAPLGEDEFYIEDLKGLNLVSDGKNAPAGVVFGMITGVVEGGGGNLLEMKLENGAARLVPFRDEFVGEVSLEKGVVVLTAPWVLE
jgi:16S rRNA processing protein RimM